MQKFEGIFPALVTPYDIDGRINAKMAEQLTEHLLEKGVSGFYVGGSTGESYLLSAEERKHLLETVIRTAGDKVPVIASIGVVATEHGIELAKHAESVGATAISAVPPIYFSFTRDEYIRYYEELSEATSLPLIVYNVPAMSGVQFSKSDLERLLSHEKILGIKHTSYDLFQLQQLIQEHPKKNIFIGHDELYLSALSVGAKAGIGSSFNIMPEKFLKIQQLFEEKKLEEALAVQGEVNRVIEVLIRVGVFKGIKEILRLQGLECGDCRKPFLPLKEAEKRMVYDCAKENHLL